MTTTDANADRLTVLDAEHNATSRAQRAYDVEVQAAARRRAQAVNAATEARDKLWDDLRERRTRILCERPHRDAAALEAVEAEMATWKTNPPPVERAAADAEYEQTCQACQAILWRRMNKIRLAAKAGDIPALNHA